MIVYINITAHTTVDSFILLCCILYVTVNQYQLFVHCRQTVDAKVLSTNIKIIAESMARHIYNLSDDALPELFTGSLVS